MRRKEMKSNVEKKEEVKGGKELSGGNRKGKEQRGRYKHANEGNEK